MKILVVDDEPMQLKSMKIGLRTEGYSVVTALSAEEAIELVKADPAFDLIITDYLMAGLNGMDLLKAIREIQSFLPVILMTAYGKKSLAVKALKGQCTGFIEKPFSLKQLLVEIARVKNLEVQNRSSLACNRSLAQIVHQINNPLTAIKGNAELALYLDSDPITLKQNLKAIIEATSKISEINKKIITMGAANKEEITKEEVDVKWLLADCLIMFEGLMALKEICIEYTMEEGDLYVWGDRFGLQQVFRNLILNAIEAMEGSMQKTLRVAAEKVGTDSWIAVHIEDTGCGISKLFRDEFFNSGRTTKENGSGLGLRIVKDVVENHKGHLQMSSQEGEGTVITVRLPIDARTSAPKAHDVFTKKSV